MTREVRFEPTKAYAHRRKTHATFLFRAYVLPLILPWATDVL